MARAFPLEYRKRAAEQEAVREKTARLRAQREERERRIGAMVENALARTPSKPGTAKSQPLSKWLDEREQFGLGT